MSKVVTITLKIGDALLYGIKLHILAILHILRGGIILGFFPTITALLEVLFNAFQNKGNVTTEKFTHLWRNYFKQSNLIGWSLLALNSFLWLDLYWAVTFLKLTALSIFLLVIALTLLGTTIFTLISMVRYELPTQAHLRQGFFLLLCSLPEYIAIILGTLLVMAFMAFLPILIFIASVPLCLFPSAWFGYQAACKLEAHQTKGDTHEMD